MRKSKHLALNESIFESRAQTLIKQRKTALDLIVFVIRIFAHVCVNRGLVREFHTLHFPFEFQGRFEKDSKWNSQFICVNVKWLSVQSRDSEIIINLVIFQMVHWIFETRNANTFKMQKIKLLGQFRQFHLLRKFVCENGSDDRYASAIWMESLIFHNRRLYTVGWETFCVVTLQITFTTAMNTETTFQNKERCVIHLEFSFE